MSVEALSWALNLAPVPVDKNGKPNAACAFVLVGLANHAAADGTGAFPSARTLVRYTRLCERTVRTALDRLEAADLIRPCDPDIVAARIKRPDRRPDGWDLNLHRVRTDLSADDLAALEPQFPGIIARVATARTEQGTTEPDKDAEPGAGQAVENPATPADHPADNPARGVQRLHPASGTGCNQRSNGVQPTTERGAAVAPEPSLEPSQEPPPAREHHPPAPAVDNGGGGPEDNDDRWTDIEWFFAHLGPAWPISGRQTDRLTPAVAAALADGWTPAALAEFVDGNTAGVRNPYAVLVSRLADLPDARAARPAASPAYQTVADALAAAGCRHGAAHPRKCALCRASQRTADLDDDQRPRE